MGLLDRLFGKCHISAGSTTPEPDGNECDHIFRNIMRQIPFDGYLVLQAYATGTKTIEGPVNMIRIPCRLCIYCSLISKEGINWWDFCYDHKPYDIAMSQNVILLDKDMNEVDIDKLVGVDN